MRICKAKFMVSGIGLGMLPDSGIVLYVASVSDITRSSKIVVSTGYTKDIFEVRVS